MMTVKMRVLATLSLCSWIFYSFPDLNEAANITFEAEGQVLVCYDGREFDGESVRLTEVKGRYKTTISIILSTISTEVEGGLVDKLVDLGWDDRISSCCFTGFWILYAEEKWNDEGGTVHKWR